MVLLILLTLKKSHQKEVCSIKRRLITVVIFQQGVRINHPECVVDKQGIVVLSQMQSALSK